MFAYHIDLKRAMWRLDYLLEFMRRLKQWGFNTVVLEIEDKFRFSRHPALAHPDAPTHGQWREWAQECRKTGMDVVPLVQTLGHLEFVMNKPAYAHLREAAGLRHHVDVTNPRSVPFVLDLVEEVIDVFQPEKFFHIGGDETAELAASERLEPWRERCGELYLKHMQPIFEYVNGRGLRPMLWHDMVFKYGEGGILPGIPKDVVMVHWNYSIIDVDSPALRITEAIMAAGLEVVTASANRCSGDQTGTPKVSRHVPNCHCLARKGLEEASGTLVTSWAIRHNHPETNMSATFAAVLASRGLADDTVEAAHEAWTNEVFGVAMRDFAAAAVKAEKGVLPIGRAGQWRQRLILLEGGDDCLQKDVSDLVQSMGSAAEVKTFLQELRKGYAEALATFRLCRSAAKHNGDLVDFWIEGVELHDFYAEFLLGALVGNLSESAPDLYNRLLVLVSETRKLFARTYTSVSVEDEILWRYGYHLEYLGRLMIGRARENVKKQDILP